MMYNMKGSSDKGVYSYTKITRNRPVCGNITAIVDGRAICKIWKVTERVVLFYIL
jgi:hypothetical protein